MDRPQTNHTHGIGLTRRELLQVGYSGLLGIGMPSVWAGQRLRRAQPPSTRKAKSVVLIFLTGAPSHLDTFDLKPEAPVEIRGDFKTIATKAPGVGFCEHLPLLAARADKLAVIRSMTHGVPSHEHATHMMLTGINVLPPGSTSHGVSGRLAVLSPRASTSSIRGPTACPTAFICRLT